MKCVYFDCFSGAGGDMIVAALVDAGVSMDRIRAVLGGLNVAGFAVSAEKVRKQGLAATKFDVTLDPGIDQPHRHLSHIEKILTAADLPERVRDRALAAFRRLAEAEARVHGITVEKIHFHEVGAVDAIVDIVAAMTAIEVLGPERIYCSAVATGTGTVTCEHGVLPVPAPATALLLEGVPVAACDEVGELFTPTAAAILTTVCSQFGAMPAMTIRGMGFGAGHRENKSRPNVLRVLVGDTVADGAVDTIAVLEANIDDSPGEWIGHCIERLLEAGAFDAYCVPITMKKSRPGVVLTVICACDRIDALESIIFGETTTFGIRRQSMLRSKLEREVVRVETSFGPIGIKLGRRHGALSTASPEFSDCAVAAKRHAVPLRTVMQAAIDAWQRGQLR